MDLLKSSWILHTVILDRNNLSSLMTDENRKLFYNLSDVSIARSSKPNMAANGFRASMRTSASTNPLILHSGKLS